MINLPTWFFVVLGFLWIFAMTRLAWQFIGHPLPGRSARMKRAATILRMRSERDRYYFPADASPRLAKEGIRHWLANPMFGTWRGHEMALGDLGVVDSSGEPARYRTIAIVPVRENLPFVSAEPSGLIELFPDRVANTGVTLESESFNRAFRVDADVDKDVQAVLSDRIMHILLRDHFGMESDGGCVYLFSDGALPSGQVPKLAQAAAQVADLIDVSDFEPVRARPIMPELITSKALFGITISGNLGRTIRSRDIMPSYLGIGSRYVRSMRFTDVLKAISAGSWRHSPAVKRYMVYGSLGLILALVPVAILWWAMLGAAGLLIWVAVVAVGAGFYALRQRPVRPHRRS